MPIYAVKTTVNQEQAVANLIERAIRGRKDHGVRAILVPDDLKGYVLIEAEKPDAIEEAIQHIPHARSLVRGETSLSEIEHFLTPKPSITGITEGSIVEIISGPLKGERARVKRVDEIKEEVTIELFDAVVPIPITVRGDSVKLLSREEEEK
ncbi:MAG: Transcription termination/antitermination protein NusG [Candidatus Alkanophagales archaeon MCA70_species_1]|nr:Transcription termination/antitermination protein NusG [Candidatus Alkanophaga volatiphilum]